MKIKYSARVRIPHDKLLKALIEAFPELAGMPNSPDTRISFSGLGAPHGETEVYHLTLSWPAGRDDD